MLSPNAPSAHSLIFSKKSDSDLALGSNVKLYQICLAVACDSGLMNFFEIRLALQREFLLSVHLCLCMLVVLLFANGLDSG